MCCLRMSYVSHPVRIKPRSPPKGRDVEGSHPSSVFVLVVVLGVAALDDASGQVEQGRHGVVAPGHAFRVELLALLTAAAIASGVHERIVALSVLTAQGVAGH